VWRETGILESFPAEGLNVLWRAEVGWGYSSPVVAQGRVFLTDARLTDQSATERVLCFDASTGKSLWTYGYEPGYPEWVFSDEGHRGPTPTPIVQDGKLYVLGGMGLLFCFDATTGEVIWKRDVGKDFGMQVPDFGTDASPLIDGELLILLLGGEAGAGVIALDRKTGEEVWRALDERRPYSSPIVLTAGASRQLIVWTQPAVTALDPSTGKTWWRQRNPITDYAVATPVFSDGLLLLSGLMLKLDASKPEAAVLWPEELSGRVLSHTSTPLLQGGYVYSGKSSGQLVCLDASTGKQVWETDLVTDTRSGASMHLTTNQGRVFLFNDRGELILAKLSAEGYQEISRAALLKPTSLFGGKKVLWVPPAYANRCIFARSDEELVCASLAEKP
jgi:outer membrane protein assembly factor BamB